LKRTFSHRVGLIKPSPIFAVTAKANALKAQGIDIISLGAGEPDFDTPDYIKTAAIQAIQKGLTKYTAVEGTVSLRRAIIKKFEQDNHPRYAPNEILVSNGAKQSIYNLIQALINPGDEVIIPAPYWVSYPDMVLLGEGKPVILPTSIDTHFKITADQLEAAITPKTRLIILNSPSNPTGVSYSAEELKPLTAVLQRHPQVWIATDDIYEYIRWSSEPFCNVLTVDPSLQSRTIVIHGVSKTYAMTGWRIGYAAGPADLIEAMTNIQSQSTSNPCSISQAAAEAALEGNQRAVGEMVHAFKLRHDYIVEALNQIEGISCLPADGAFYVFPNCQALIDKMPHIQDDVALAEYLIQEAKVALVPGSAFGAPGYLRLSFATSMPNLEASIARLNQALSGL
jgi:aspartate aminotransferase